MFMMCSAPVAAGLGKSGTGAGTEIFRVKEGREP